MEEQIRACLQAGADGVEISNGPEILNWLPSPEIVSLLKDKTLTIHAELVGGVTLDTLAYFIRGLPFTVENVTFHPDELSETDLKLLSSLPFKASIENMDVARSNWRTVEEVKAVIEPGVGFTLDTAHVQSNDLSISQFAPLFVPVETHLSNDNSFMYDTYGYKVHHVPTHFTPDDFPDVPRACLIVTLEGVMPNFNALKNEIDFVKGRLRGE